MKQKLNVLKKYKSIFLIFISLFSILVVPIFANKPNPTVKDVGFIGLCFHKVDYSNDPLSLHPEQFRQFLREMVADGYTFIDIDDVVDFYKTGKPLPEKPVFISFDDGYKDNYVYAYPILKEEGAKATFYLVSDHIGNNERMTKEDLEEMIANGFKIGSHTVDHEDLNEMTESQIKDELKRSKEDLENMFHVPVKSVAYPGGSVGSLVLNIAAKYYDVGFLAKVNDSIPESKMTIQRYGVFLWNTSFQDVLERNKEEG